MKRKSGIYYCSLECPNKIKFKISCKNKTYNIVRLKKEIILNSKNIPKSKKFIVVIVESPHIEEFYGDCAISPLNGESGKRFCKYFVNCLQSNGKTSSYLKNGVKIAVINPVRHQASLGICPISETIKELVWEQMFKCEKDYFVDLIKKFKKKNILVLNLCTEGSVVKMHDCISDIMHNEKIRFYNEKHPITWNSKKKFSLN